MTTQEKINYDLKTAMLAKNQLTVDVLRQLKNALSNVALLSGNITNPVSDEVVLTNVRKLIAQRRDSVEQFVKGGRQELADKETAEIAILEKYLPIALTDEELDGIIKQAIADTVATSKKDMGKVIKRTVELAQGRVDNKTISMKVSKPLN
jgi:uncharacterized protein YqeY